MELAKTKIKWYEDTIMVYNCEGVFSHFVDLEQIRSLIINTAFEDDFLASLHSIPARFFSEEREKIIKAKIKTRKFGIWDKIVAGDAQYQQGFRDGYKESCIIRHEKIMTKSIETVISNSDLDNTTISNIMGVSVEFVKKLRTKIR
jgi:hypothetical protein